MNAAKDCTLQEKLLRCAMALILAAGALLASVAASPAYAAPSTVDVSIGGKIPYGGFATTWMSADGNIAYCAEPSSPTPAPGSYSTSPVPSGDVTAAIWYSFGSPGFDASMFPGSWYDGGGWDDAKYAAASHVLIAYAYSGSESAATHGTSAEFASWAKSELIGGTFAKMEAGAGKVSAGFEAFCVRTGGGSQTLVSFSWSAGGVKVAKEDSEAGAEPQGDASLDGASFSVVNETGRYVLVGGKYYADGEACATIKTAPEGGSHVAATGADALPAGSYRIVESGAPEGYDASDAPVAFTVRAGEMRDLTGDPVTDEVFRGGVQVTKSDKELQASEALAGSGHKEAPGEHPGLDGIEFTVTNRSAHKVLVDGEWREPGEAVATLTTAWNDEAGAYTAQTAANALPYGTYDVRETATNGSYLLTDGEPRTFEVRAAGEVVSASADGTALEFRDQVVRNDLELSKKSESDNAGLMVPFAIENAATGETHVLVTDRNGDASTASSWNRHSRDTNANDALLGHEGPIGAADMDPKAGIWFSLGEDGSSAPVDDSLAALPYGAYTMTELRCDANEGLELITRSFWIDRDSTVAKAVWMGLDDQEGPRISTTAKDGADGDKDVSADAEAKVVDAVAYEGLKAGEEYELSATLVDKATGEPVADASGMPVGAKAEFAPALSTGSRDVEISFDASLLGGRDLVVFESLRKDGAEVASHADLSDEGQTVHVAVEVGTQAADAADGDQVIEAGKAKVVDTVAYKGLVPGETYIAVGTLMDKGTGEPFLDKDGNEVTARTPFEPEAPSGTVEVTFERKFERGFNHHIARIGHHRMAIAPLCLLTRYFNNFAFGRDAFQRHSRRRKIAHIGARVHNSGTANGSRNALGEFVARKARRARGFGNRQIGGARLRDHAIAFNTNRIQVFRQTHHDAREAPIGNKQIASQANDAHRSFSGTACANYLGNLFGRLRRHHNSCRAADAKRYVRGHRFSDAHIFGTNDSTKRIEKRLARHPFLFGHTNLLVEGAFTSSKGEHSSAQPIIQRSQIIVAALAQARRSSPKTHRHMPRLLNATSI